MWAAARGEKGRGDAQEERVSKLAWQERVERVMYETLGIMRSSQMFDIVMDYPATRGAITDLRVCMAYTDLHRHFVERFRSALQDRLLIPGPPLLRNRVSS